MPTLGQILDVTRRVASPVIDYAVNRGTRGAVTNTVNQGANAAGARLDAAARDATARQDRSLVDQRAVNDRALTDQRGIYDTATANQAPYQQAGLSALERYRQMIETPEQFDFSQEPGTQFALDQAFKATDRQFRASGQASNGGQVVRQQRSALDEANRLYNDALTRFRATQGDKKALLEGGIDVGQGANAAVQGAGVTLGNAIDSNATREGGAIDQNADAVGEINLRNAEDQAALEILRSEAAAGQQIGNGTDTGNTIGKLLDAAPGILDTIRGVAAPAAGTAATLGSLLGGGGAATAGLAAGVSPVGMTLPALAAEYGSTAGAGSTGILGGLGATGVGAIAALAIAGGLLAKKYIGAGRKQADKLTGEGGIQREFENVLDEIDADQTLATATDKWAAKTREYEALEKLGLEFATKGKNQKKVAQQMFAEISHLFGRPNPLGDARL